MVYFYKIRWDQQIIYLIAIFDIIQVTLDNEDYKGILIISNRQKAVQQTRNTKDLFPLKRLIKWRTRDNITDMVFAHE